MPKLLPLIEHALKKPIWDCRMCGQCVLHSTGMTCPMTCPKTLRNGPCGGVRENGNCEVVPGLSQTFGQNIHTLLSDGFFLDDGLMGDFAKGKIQEVITDLNRVRKEKEDFERNEKETNGTEIYRLKEEDREKLSGYEKIIGLIGEPVLRIKLGEMLNNCLGKDGEIQRLKQEIEEKEKRIKQIEERRKKNDSN